MSFLLTQKTSSYETRLDVCEILNLETPCNGVGDRGVVWVTNPREAVSDAVRGHNVGDAGTEEGG